MKEAPSLFRGAGFRPQQCVSVLNLYRAQVCESSARLQRAEAPLQIVQILSVVRRTQNQQTPPTPYLSSWR